MKEEACDRQIAGLFRIVSSAAYLIDDFRLCHLLLVLFIANVSNSRPSFRPSSSLAEHADVAALLLVLLLLIVNVCAWLTVTSRPERGQ